MKTDARWEVPKSYQLKIINALTADLAPLRAKVGISQGELSKLIGISRQTYSAIECGNRIMSWNTCLSLILFYDYNNSTHEMIRNIGAFPEELIRSFNNGNADTYSSTNLLFGMPEGVLDKLDDAAFQSIRTVVMLEYARCAKLSGESVVKSFDGVTFGNPNKSAEAFDALREIKESRKKN